MSAQTILVVGLTLMLHTLAQRVGAAFRFLFYIPGALAGAASVIVWLFMLDPTASPFAFVLHGFGYAQFNNTIAPENLPVIFAIMAFWIGAGGWIVVMYGALNNIPHELLEVRTDRRRERASQTALWIKLPLIRKWIVYMLVLSFAGGTQLFVEPTVLGSAALGVGISKYWSPNQLAWFVASQYDQLQRSRCDLSRSARTRPHGRGSARLARKALRGRVMALPRRYALRFVGLVILLFFTAFFFVPIIWLLLAPTKTDGQLLTQSPFAFGSLSTLGHTFHRVVTYSGHSLLIWLKNSAIYSFGGTALAVLAAIPAGYGLALTNFIGRRLLLSITLVVMIMPATALVLPLFLEINKLGLYGTIWSLILPFGFFPFGVYLAYIYFSSTIPKDLLAAARIDGAARMGRLPLHRPAARAPDRLARRVLRVRRLLEQLLPPVRDDLRQLAVPSSRSGSSS